MLNFVVAVVLSYRDQTKSNRFKLGRAIESTLYRYSRFNSHIEHKSRAKYLLKSVCSLRSLGRLASYIPGAAAPSFARVLSNPLRFGKGLTGFVRSPKPNLLRTPAKLAPN